jgi:hypothetical protein
MRPRFPVYRDTFLPSEISNSALQEAFLSRAAASSSLVPQFQQHLLSRADNPTLRMLPPLRESSPSIALTASDPSAGSSASNLFSSSSNLFSNSNSNTNSPSGRITTAAAATGGGGGAPSPGLHLGEAAEGGNGLSARATNATNATVAVPIVDSSSLHDFPAGFSAGAGAGAGGSSVSGGSQRKSRGDSLDSDTSALHGEILLPPEGPLTRTFTFCFTLKYMIVYFLFNALLFFCCCFIMFVMVGAKLTAFLTWAASIAPPRPPLLGLGLGLGLGLYLVSRPPSLPQPTTPLRCTPPTWSEATAPVSAGQRA